MQKKGYFLNGSAIKRGGGNGLIIMLQSLYLFRRRRKNILKKLIPNCLNTCNRIWIKKPMLSIYSVGLRDKKLIDQFWIFWVNLQRSLSFQVFHLILKLFFCTVQSRDADDAGSYAYLLHMDKIKWTLFHLPSLDFSLWPIIALKTQLKLKHGFRDCLYLQLQTRNYNECYIFLLLLCCWHRRY